MLCVERWILSVREEPARSTQESQRGATFLAFPHPCPTWTLWETGPTFVPLLSQKGWLALLAFLTETKDAAQLKLPDTAIPPPPRAQ